MKKVAIGMTVMALCAGMAMAQIDWDSYNKQTKERNEKILEQRQQKAEEQKRARQEAQRARQEQKEREQAEAEAEAKAKAEREEKEAKEREKNAKIFNDLYWNNKNKWDN